MKNRADTVKNSEYNKKVVTGRVAYTLPSSM